MSGCVRHRAAGCPFASATLRGYPVARAVHLFLIIMDRSAKLQDPGQSAVTAGQIAPAVDRSQAPLVTRAVHYGIRALMAGGYLFGVGCAASDAAATAAPLGGAGGIVCGDDVERGAAAGLECGGDGLRGRLSVGAVLGVTFFLAGASEGVPGAATAGACAPSPAFVPCAERSAGRLSGKWAASSGGSDPERPDPDGCGGSLCATDFLSIRVF